MCHDPESMRCVMVSNLLLFVRPYRPIAKEANASTRDILIEQRKEKKRKAIEKRTSKLPAYAAQCNGVNFSSFLKSISLTLAPRPTIASKSLTLFSRTMS